MLIKPVGLNVIVFTIQNKLKNPYDFTFISLFDKFYEKQEIAARDWKIEKNAENRKKGRIAEKPTRQVLHSP